MDKPARLRIGTRGSPLARTQANLVRDALITRHPDLAEPGAVRIDIIKTTGDRIQDRSLAGAGGKGLFTKEIEEGLLARRIDLAVHSMKDMPTILPPGLVIAAMLPRADPRDALIAPCARHLDELPEACTVGSASLRRAAQILERRPDITVSTLRGNVESRLRKVAEGEFAATLLAVAGLARLGLLDRAAAVLGPEEMLPAVAQGAIGIECRQADPVLELVQLIDDAQTSLCVGVERAMLACLDGSCRTPIAGYCRLERGGLVLDALVARPDGSVVHRARRRSAVGDAAVLGPDAGLQLKAKIGPGFFDG